MDKNMKIKNLKKIITIFTFSVFLFISVDRELNIAPQREIIKKIVYITTNITLLIWLNNLVNSLKFGKNKKHNNNITQVKVKIIKKFAAILSFDCTFLPDLDDLEDGSL